jgi:hypothetical protein
VPGRRAFSSPLYVMEGGVPLPADSRFIRRLKRMRIFCIHIPATVPRMRKLYNTGLEKFPGACTYLTAMLVSRRN